MSDESPATIYIAELKAEVEALQKVFTEAEVDTESKDLREIARVLVEERDEAVAEVGKWINTPLVQEVETLQQKVAVAEDALDGMRHGLAMVEGVIKTEIVNADRTSYARDNRKAAKKRRAAREAQHDKA